jgi:hypothetical protein
LSLGWKVTASDIKVWTETKKRDAEALLPLLIKKLIIASSKPEEVHFPSGDSIAVGGLDGELIVEEGNSYIPAGKSIWEFGTNQQVKGKADGDYTKRTLDYTNNEEEEDRIQASEITFVFVTSRIWSNKNKWIKEKKKDKVWKDVKGINADDIESWLELCPAVHRWFASILGKRTDSSLDIDQAWESWSNCTSPCLNEQIVLKGRDEEKKLLTEHLESSSNLVRVKYQSEEEAYAFIIATIKNSATISPKTLVIRSQKAWDILVDSLNPLVLVPYKFIPENLGYARKRGHNVVLTEPETVSLQSSDLKLEKMSRSNRITALISLGLSELQAEEIYKHTRGYLEIIKRHPLLTPQDRVLPGWIDKYDTQLLFAIFCATEWNRKYPKDISTLSKISSLPHEELEQKLYELKNEEESPIRLLGDVWQLISKIDFWSLIFHKVEQTHIERLGEVVIDALGEADLSYALSEGEILFKSLNSISEQHSEKIKTGIADTLALIASLHGDNEETSEYSNFNELINYYVKTVFENYNSPEMWYNLREYFVPLAEASPDIFLLQLEKALEINPTPIRQMFEGKREWRCTHASLLWSLELISWDLNSFTRVVKILAHLCEIDPGGRYSNRPINTLKEMFLGWVVNSKVSLDYRFQIMENVLIKRFPKLSWELLISLLPGNTTISSSIHKPKYRNWAQNSEESVLASQYAIYINKISFKLVELVQLNPKLYCKDLIDNLENLCPEACNAAIEGLKLIGQQEDNDEVNILIYNELRKQVARHKEFHDCEWALPIEVIKELEILHEEFKPKSIIARVIYLFDDHYPDLIMPISHDRTNYKFKQECIKQERIESLNLLFKEEGFNGIEELIKQAKEPYTIGETISQCSLKLVMEEILIKWLENTDEKILFCAKSFIYRMSHNNHQWVKKVIQSFESYSKNIQLNFLQAISFSSQIYNLIEQLDEDLKTSYWVNIPWSKLQIESDNVNLVIEKLVIFKRSLAAIKLFSTISYAIDEKLKVDCNLLAKALLDIELDPEYNKIKDLKGYSHDIYIAINYIQKEESLENEVIIKIEWFYLPLFRFDRFKPIFLEKNILENPELFAQVLSWCTRSQGEIDKGEFKELDSRREASVSLLDSLSKLPGQNSKKDIDYNTLKDWVIRARNTLKELDRERIGDDEIGKLLVNAPVGTDNIWPHESVRDLLEDIQSSYIERGLENGIRNGRGVTVRSVYEGGRQEKELAKKYQQDSKQISLLWPRTSRMLRSISETYKRDAWREDLEVELRA